MRFKLKNLTTVCVFAMCWQAHGNDATWTGAVSADLVSTPGNWSPSGAPSGIATFNSAYPSVQLSPTANAQLSLDSFYFPNSASAFQFTFTDAALVFTGLGITGTNTNTQITFTNTGSLASPQLFLNTSDSSTVSFGAANLFLANSAAGSLSFSSGNAAQLSLGDKDYTTAYPLTAGSNVSVSVTNYGTISGYNEAGQIFLKGSTYTVGDQYLLTALNSGGSAMIQSDSDTGQIVFDADLQTANFTLGDNAQFSLSNTNGASIASSYRGNNAAQILFDGHGGTAAFTLGNSASLTLTNDNSVISTVVTGNDVGQMVFDGNRGFATYSAGDDASLILYNQNSGMLSGLGFDTGQIVVDGDSGTASFSVGNNASLTLINDSSSTIATGSDGNDAGQIVVDANSGASSFTIGNQGVINVTNSGTISSTSGAYAAQIVFDGSEGTVSLSAGTNVTITATNNEGAAITNTGSNSAAQMYFSSATVTGSPTLAAINHNPTIGSIQGIVFDGASSSSNANIVLQNTSLVVNTGSEFLIGFLTGDSTSKVQLGNNLGLLPPSGTYEFAGEFSDISGSNDVTFNGTGTQVLSGSNICGGTTFIKSPLILTGSILHDAHIESAILAGTGSIGGNLFVDDETIVSPQIGNGNTLSVGGAVTLHSGSTANFEINQAGENSMLAVSGSATIDSNVSVTVSQDPGAQYPRSGLYMILTADAITGSFNPTVTGGLPGFPFVLAYADPSVFLSYAVPDIATTGISGNALKVANYLNSYGSGSCVALFEGLSGGELARALNSVSPSRNAFVPYIMQQTAFSLSALLSSHIDLLSFSSEASAGGALAANWLADASDAISIAGSRHPEQQRSCQEKLPKPSKNLSIWASGFGEYAHQSAKLQNPSFHYVSGAVLAGLDYKGGHGTLAGGALGYAHTSFHEARDAGSGNINSYFASVYGNVFFHNFYLSPALWGFFNQAHQTRHVFFPGFSEKAKAHIYSWQINPHLEIGYDCRLSWGEITPFSALDWAISWQRGYAEHGASFFNATEKSHTSSMARSETGLKFCEKWSFSWGAFFLKEKASYVFQKPFGTGKIKTAFTGIPSSFTVTAVNENLNLGVAAIDFLAAIGKKDPVSVNLGYEGEFGSSYWSNQIMLTLKKDF